MSFSDLSSWAKRNDINKAGEWANRSSRRSLLEKAKESGSSVEELLADEKYIDAKIYTEYVETGNSFKMNEFLREITDDSQLKGSVFEGAIKSLDKAMQTDVFTEDIALQRFVGKGYMESMFGSSSKAEIEKYIGSTIENKQFLSTTVSGNPCFDGKPAIMTIRCDAGTKCFPTTNISEGEIILPRGSKTEVIDIIDHKENPMILKSYGRNGKVTESNYYGLEIVTHLI